MEPMELDSDGDSSFRRSQQRFPSCLHSPLSANNNHSGSDVSDMDIDAHSPMQSQNSPKCSASCDLISSVLNSVLSIRQGCDNDTKDSVQISQGATRNNCGDDISGEHNSNTMNKFTNPCEPVPMPLLKKGKGTSAFEKPGYGLKQDSLFAQFPESQSPASDKNYSLQRRMKLQSSDENPVLPRKIRPLFNKISDPKHQELSESGSKILTCKHIFILVIVCIISVLFTKLIYSQKKMCKVERYFNRKVLEMDLEANVFGQHIASEIVPDKIDEYLHKFYVSNDLSMSISETEFQNVPLCKPLVLSFHGGTGVGKNYISKIISDSFQHTKMTHFIMPFHFPHRTYESLYKDQIEQWIVGNTTSCAVNVVVVDEMDKAFPAVVEGIANAITALTQPCSKARPTLILLLSNSHAIDINRAFLRFLSITYKKREKFSLEDLGSIFKDDSEWWYSYLLSRKILDAFVPFLPLEKTHIIQCIKRDLVSKRFSTDSQSIDKILKELSISKHGHLELSSTGCKRVADKVDLIMLDKL